MKSNFPKVHQGIGGVYQVKVVEPIGLAALRRRAAKIAGLTDFVLLGSVYEWEALSPINRQIGDLYLRRLVEENPDLLDQSCVETQVRAPDANLILDQGMNQIAGTIFSRIAAACAIGTGTDPVNRDSAAVTVAIAGSTATANSTFFVAGDVGRLIKCDSGELAYISGYVSGTVVSVVGTFSVASTPFTIWYVNQVGLGSESQRTTTYLTGTGNCGSSRSTNVLTWKWTYDGRVETTNQNYSELGFSGSPTAGNNLWSRVLITGGTVAVLVGQRIRVIYSVNVTVTPTAAPGSGTATITGWPVAPSTLLTGTYQWVGVAGDVGGFGFSQLNTSGVSDGTPDYMGPSGGFSLTLATNTVIPAFAAGVSPTNGVSSDSTSLDSYVSGAFHRTKTAFWGLSSANRSDWRSVMVVNNLWMWLFTESQTKDSSHTLTLTLDFIWSRTLTNP